MFSEYSYGKSVEGYSKVGAGRANIDRAMILNLCTASDDALYSHVQRLVNK